MIMSDTIQHSFIFRFNLIFFVLTYILPMVGMAVCYGQMGVHLWRGAREIHIKTIMPHTASIKQRKRKKRVRVSLS